MRVSDYRTLARASSAQIVYAMRLVDTQLAGETRPARTNVLEARMRLLVEAKAKGEKERHGVRSCS